MTLFLTHISAETQRAIKNRLRAASLRPTRQRILLASLLFSDNKQHVSADMLAQQIAQMGEHLAIATIYNCLHQFEAAGMVQRVPSGDDAIMFDTNMSYHHHFLIEETGELIDIPSHDIKADLPDAPQGYEIEAVELVVKIKKKHSLG
ncbi:MAG: Fur family transcriptional regulator [Candidatus Puniceispirillaceae bacterium]